MTSKKPLLFLRVKLGEKDATKLAELVEREGDTIAALVRRMIRARYKRIFDPNPNKMILTTPFARQQ